MPTSSISLDDISCHYYTLDGGCSWFSATSEDDVMECVDGTYCNSVHEGWTCCNAQGGRARCPQNYPFMCAEKNCAIESGNAAYCCGNDLNFCIENNGGIRKCEGKLN